MSPSVDGQPVSNRWSCSTLMDGLDHVREDMAQSQDEEARLLQELKEIQYKTRIILCIALLVVLKSNIVNSCISILSRRNGLVLASLCFTLSGYGLLQDIDATMNAPQESEAVISPDQMLDSMARTWAIPAFLSHITSQPGSQAQPVISVDTPLDIEATQPVWSWYVFHRIPFVYNFHACMLRRPRVSYLQPRLTHHRFSGCITAWVKSYCSQRTIIIFQLVIYDANVGCPCIVQLGSEHNLF